jgi:glycogen synthase
MPDCHQPSCNAACLFQVSCVTRLVHQKGIHLIKHAAWRTCERGAQFVLLGSAPDPKIQVGAGGCAWDC